MSDTNSDVTSHPPSLAPHSAESEEAVLGAVLINPDSFFDVDSFLKAEDFFILRNRMVWEAMRAIQARGDAIDNLTVIAELGQRKQLEMVGGSAYITGLINNTPTHIHAETYGHMVERAAIRRQLIRAGSDIARAAFQENAEVAELINDAESTLFAVTNRSRRNDLLTVQELISHSIDAVEAMYMQKAQLLGLPTGFTDIDRMLSGLEKSRLYIVAGRPGIGKTSWLLNAAANAMKLARSRVGIFSLEMNDEQLIRRLQSAETGLDSKKIRLGKLADDEWSNFLKASGRILQWPFHIDDTSGLTIPKMRARMRYWQRHHGLDLVIVDYLQLLQAVGTQGSREAQVSEIARGLKQLAREFDIPVLAAAQLSRAVEGRQDKRPQLSDLRESGEIENSADVVLFIYRDEVYNEHSARRNQADIIIAKNRDGETGAVTLYFKKAVTQFTNMKSG